MKRRELLEVSAFLRRFKMDPTDPVALGLAIQYREEKSSGETELGFQEWLDVDVEDEDDETEDEAAEGEEVDPTQSPE